MVMNTFNREPSVCNVSYILCKLIQTKVFCYCQYPQGEMSEQVYICAEQTLFANKVSYLLSVYFAHYEFAKIPKKQN